MRNSFSSKTTVVFKNRETETASEGAPYKKVFLKISQNS